MEAMTKALSGEKSLNLKGSTTGVGENEPAWIDAHTLSRMVAKGSKALPRTTNTTVDFTITSPAQRFNPRYDGQFERAQWSAQSAHADEHARHLSAKFLDHPSTIPD